MSRSAGRWVALDGLRGLIIALMALDHASAFVANQHWSEFWGLPLPDYGDAASLLTRVVSHLCAPGFCLLMGVSMRLFATARAERGWSHGRTLRHFAIRGLVLIAVDYLLVNPAWLYGHLDSEIVFDGSPLFAMPGATAEIPYLSLGVLGMLGATMLLCGLLLGAGPWGAAVVGVAAILLTQIALPEARYVDEPFAMWLRVLLVPGQTGIVSVSYPVLPWLGVTALGIAYGHAIERYGGRALSFATPVGLVCCAAFVVVRLGSGFGNLHPPGSGWMAFLTLTKYPPSLAFLLLAIGGNALLLGALHVAGAALERARPLLVFGRTPLFFYVIHLYVYGTIGLAYPGDTSLLGMYPFWLIGLGVMFPLCARYEHFKRGRRGDSLWRLF